MVGGNINLNGRLRKIDEEEQKKIKKTKKKSKKQNKLCTFLNYIEQSLIINFCYHWMSLNFCFCFISWYCHSCCKFCSRIKHL